MKTPKLKLAAIAAAATITLILILPSIIDVDRFRPQFESALTSSLRRDVHLGHMQLSLLAGGARVDQISIADDPTFKSGPFLEAKSLGVGVSLLSLIFSRSLHVTSLDLDEPRVSVMQSADGKWNLSTLGGASDPSETHASTTPSMPFVLDHLKISNATIELASPGQPTVLHNIDVDLRNASLSTAMTFVLSARTGSGQLKIEGEAGPINHDNPDQTPFHATINANNADLAQIASLGANSALAGLLTFSGSVSSDGSTIHSEGHADATRLRLLSGGELSTQPVALHYATDYNIASKSGVLHDSAILAGGGTANLSGTYAAHGTGIALHIKLAGSQLPVDNVQGILPAIGIVLPAGAKLHGGAMDANLSFDGPVERVITSGTAKISNSHLSGLDLGSKLSSLPGMSALQSGTELSIQELSTQLRISPETTNLTSMNGQFPGIGTITGDGDISASNHLQFKMVARIAPTGDARWALNHVGLKNVPNVVPFQIVGTTSMPVIIPDLTSMAKTTAKTAATQLATNAGKSVMQKTAANQPVVASNKKSGFFHNLFHRNKQSNTPQLAAQQTKY